MSLVLISNCPLECPYLVPLLHERHVARVLDRSCCSGLMARHAREDANASTWRSWMATLLVSSMRGSHLSTFMSHACCLHAYCSPRSSLHATQLWGHASWGWTCLVDPLRLDLQAGHLKSQPELSLSLCLKIHSMTITSLAVDWHQPSCNPNPAVLVVLVLEASGTVKPAELC